MATFLVSPKPVSIERGERDDKGYRTYWLTWLVKSTTGLDGPYNVLRTPGLPRPGSIWNINDDIDPFVWCRMQTEVLPKKDKPGGKIYFWQVKQKFSNAPYQNPEDNNERSCTGEDQQNPLLQPAKISGSSESEKEEGTYDKDGNKILSSSFEPLRGPQNEWPISKSVVNIEMNVPSLRLDLLNSMVNHVNSIPLWGLPPRFILFESYSWDRKLWGNCLRYFTWKLKFVVFRRFNYETGEYTSGWDRFILDEGAKCLRGDWDRNTVSLTYRKWQVDPDISNIPNHHKNPAFYDRFRDWNGNLGKCILKNGVPISEEEDPGTILVRYYKEANFYLLGIPTNLES